MVFFLRLKSFPPFETFTTANERVCVDILFLHFLDDSRRRSDKHNRVSVSDQLAVYNHGLLVGA